MKERTTKYQAYTTIPQQWTENYTNIGVCTTAVYTFYTHIQMYYEPEEEKGIENNTRLKEKNV